MARVLAIVNVLGNDQKGVVARISTSLAERDVNIEDIEQRVVRGQFLMDMLVDITEASVSLDELITGLLRIGSEIGMEIRVTLHGERERKRVAVLVTKEEHCLEQLLADARSGESVVMSSTPNCAWPKRPAALSRGAIMNPMSSAPNDGF